MDLKPVKHVKTPKYPLKTQISADAIKQHVPKRWACSPAAKVALGTLAAMTLAGCVPDIPLAGVPVPPSTKTEESVTPSMIEIVLPGEPLANTISVAPMFLHGEGRGAFGCVMIAPPVFLSENDALAVINEAAKEYGLNFSAKDQPVFEDVVQPATKMYATDDPEPPDKVMRFTPDFADAEHGVSIEFISTGDVRSWNYAEENISAGSYDTKDAADQLSDSLEKAVPEDYGFYTVGVLYDPCETDRPEEPWDQEERSKAEAKAFKMSQEQLRSQAVDFFEWLKQQGVI